jgi:hypothetical protein
MFRGQAAVYIALQAGYLNTLLLASTPSNQNPSRLHCISKCSKRKDLSPFFHLRAGSTLTFLVRRRIPRFGLSTPAQNPALPVIFLGHQNSFLGLSPKGKKQGNVTNYP